MLSEAQGLRVAYNLVAIRKALSEFPKSAASDAAKKIVRAEVKAALFIIEGDGVQIPK